jgi:hypothetical protein
MLLSRGGRLGTLRAQLAALFRSLEYTRKMQVVKRRKSTCCVLTTARILADSNRLNSFLAFHGSLLVIRHA